MELGLESRVVLVTGGSHGIGKAIATAFAKSGAKVITCSRNADKNLQSEMWLLGVDIVSADATEIRDVRSMIWRCRNRYGKLDVLVNNVGRAEKFGSFFDLSDDDWMRSYQLNFMSMVYFCREAIPWLRESDQARIINISSLPAHQPGFFNPDYSAAKAAMLNLSKHLANILARDQILVNAVCPSTLKGGGWERNVKNRAEREGISVAEAEARTEKENVAKTPLGRLGTVEDVAELVVFLASRRANYITGQCIDVDGGISRSIL